MKDFFIGIINSLQFEIERPTSYGLFHLCCLAACLIASWLLIRSKEKDHEKRLKMILGFYGFTALLLEAAKQIVWSYDGTWNYQWYAAPFQLCTTPIYSSIIALFLPECRIRRDLLAYMAYVTVLGSLATAIYPESCFVKTLLVDVHSMFLHLGSLTVSVYLLAKETDFSENSFRGSCLVFLVFAAIAEIMNVTVYRSGILNEQTFNMFYISPYFISALPVFSSIQERLPFMLFLAVYLMAIVAGARIVFMTAKHVRKKLTKDLTDTSIAVSVGRS